ncbi:MAG: nucleotidyltransferase substrate binding protein [Oscillospiraceae bacterium]
MSSQLNFHGITIREYLLSQEITDINSPKSVLSEAYNNRLITDDNGWLQILRDKNSTSHM